MAQRKAPPKQGKAKRPGKAPTRKPAAKRAPPGPRSQMLPGMEHVRDQTLDRLCESVGEGRDAMAQLRENEAGDLQAALTRMRARNLHTYQHAGVEMARVPGEEKLRVRATKDKATAAVDEGGTGGEFAKERAGAVEEVGEPGD